MEKIIELFENQINVTTTAFPSIFSKDDVVKLLLELKDNVTSELTLIKANQPITNDSEQIVKVIKDMLDNYDFDQYLEYEPELHGSYGGSYSLEINARFDETQFTRDFLCELPDYFETNNE